MSIFAGLLLVIVLVAASGFFVAVEFALVASDRAKLEEAAADGRWPARSAVRALKRLSFHLSGAQLGITLTSLVLGFVAEPVVGRLIEPLLEPIVGSRGPSLSIFLALMLATVFQMLVGELVPKNIAVAHPEKTAQLLSPAATIVHGLLSPVIILFNGAANWLIRRMGIEPREELATHRNLEEVEYLIRSSSASGALDPAARDLLNRALRFGDRTAADALTPRFRIQGVPVSATIADLEVEASTSRHSRYPVFAEDLDDVRGVVTITGIFETPQSERGQVGVAAIMSEPLVVPETRDLADIITDLRTAEVQMAIVIDEHGGTAGILTLEDVLEEIVGDVADEHDEEQALTVGVEDGLFVVGGGLHVDEVGDLSGLEIPSGEYETVAGFMLQRLGRIPAVGDGLTFDDWRIEVVEMDGLRIASLQLTAPDAAPGDWS